MRHANGSAMQSEIIACWLLLVVDCGAVAVGLHSIKKEYFAVTNICNEQFYPKLCGKANLDEK
jgi:hypothetical protein